MIDPATIGRKALRQLPVVLREVLEEALPTVWLPAVDAPRPLFPLDIPGDRGRSTDPFAARRKGIEKLLASSKARTGAGYTVLLREVSTRREGTQSVVDRIRFETREDYLASLTPCPDLDAFVREAVEVAGRLPALASWIHRAPLAFMEHTGKWADLTAVCEYIARHPRPACYARQLPLPVHTKFVEENRGILTRLLDLVLPPSAVEAGARTFESRFGLREPELLVRLRFLDPCIAPGLPDDMALPAGGLSRLDVRCRFAFIVENLMTFLAFPAVEGAVCIWGGGFRAVAAASLPWLKACRTLYWGDLDLPGFEILATLRLPLPKVESMLMDERTYRRYGAYAVEGPAASPSWAARSEALTHAERTAAEVLAAAPRLSRVEQERITHADVVDFLVQAGFRLL